MPSQGKQFTVNGRYAIKRKKRSKLDKAYANSERNKKVLYDCLEVQMATASTISTALDTTPALTYLAPAGTGLKTRLTSVQLRGTIKKNVSSTANDGYRIDIVVDRHPDKSVLTSLLYYGTDTPKIGQYKNFNLKKRYKVLRTYAGVLGVDDQQGLYIDTYIKLNLINETAIANTWTNLNQMRNAVYVIYYTDVSNNHPIIELQARLVCIDA